MVYTQMLFAVAADKIIWGTDMGWGSVVGCAAILGSAIVVAVSKNDGAKKNGPDSEGRKRTADEERGALLRDRDGDGDDDECAVEVEENTIRGVDGISDGDVEPLRSIQEVQLRAMRH